MYNQYQNIFCKIFTRSHVTDLKIITGIRKISTCIEMGRAVYGNSQNCKLMFASP